MSDVIEKLAAMEAKATGGPYLIDHDKRSGGVDQIIEMNTGRLLTIAFGTSNGNESDLPLLCYSRNALPALLKLAAAYEIHRRAVDDDENVATTREAVDRALAEVNSLKI